MIGCVQFEEIKAMEPAKYIGDSFERVSRILVVTLYNIACCYSALKAADAGLEALEECLRSGFDDYGKVGTSPLPSKNTIFECCGCATRDAWKNVVEHIHLQLCRC